MGDTKIQPVLNVFTNIFYVILTVQKLTFCDHIEKFRHSL